MLETGPSPAISLVGCDRILESATSLPRSNRGSGLARLNAEVSATRTSGEGPSDPARLSPSWTLSRAAARGVVAELFRVKVDAAAPPCAPRVGTCWLACGVVPSSTPGRPRCGRVVRSGSAPPWGSWILRHKIAIFTGDFVDHVVIGMPDLDCGSCTGAALHSPAPEGRIAHTVVTVVIP